MSYIVKNSETITDVVLNLTGDITSWESVLSLNGFTEWVPTLTEGQTIETAGIVNNIVQSQFTLNPLNNYSIPNLAYKIALLRDTLDTVTVEEFISPVIQSIIATYTVKDGETIGDVILNKTGTFDNWETILKANDFEDWTPILTAGQHLIISYLDLQQNVMNEFSTNPICNNTGIQDFDTQVINLISKFENAILFDAELTEMLYDSDLKTALYN